MEAVINVAPTAILPTRAFRQRTVVIPAVTQSPCSQQILILQTSVSQSNAAA